MANSNKWNMNDNIYSLSRSNTTFINPAKLEDVVKVEKCIIDYALTHSKNECYLYNNRLFLMHINPSEKRTQQYNVNRNYITININ